MYLLIKPLIPSNSCLLLRSMSMNARRQMFRAAGHAGGDSGPQRRANGKKGYLRS